MKMVIKLLTEFKPLIIIAGGLSFYWLSDFLLFHWTMTYSSYGQAFKFYKENYEDFKRQNENLYFEQGRASCYTSNEIIVLLEKFYDDKFIQKNPQSQDIAYPIKTLWAEIK